MLQLNQEQILNLQQSLLILEVGRLMLGRQVVFLLLLGMEQKLLEIGLKLEIILL